MGGLGPNTPIPTEITLHKQSKLLEIAFNDGQRFKLPFEYLRVFSPSAEVRGHRSGQAVLQVGKKYVDITNIEPVGQYGVRLFFGDGHNTGIYSWDYFYDLGLNQARYWQDDLARLEAARASREPKAQE